MSILTSTEIRALLSALRAKYGTGYSDDVFTGSDGSTVEIGSLQAKLSVMLEMAARRERQP